MANNTDRSQDMNEDDDAPVTRESSRGGNEPPADVNDRPDQNVGYDEAVKGAPLTADEQRRAERESPLSAGDNRRLGDQDGNRNAGDVKSRGVKT